MCVYIHIYIRVSLSFSLSSHSLYCAQVSRQARLHGPPGPWREGAARVWSQGLRARGFEFVLLSGFRALGCLISKVLRLQDGFEAQWCGRSV